MSDRSSISRDKFDAVLVDMDNVLIDTAATSTVRVFPGAVEFITALRAAGVRTMAFSANGNMDTVLDSAGVCHLFDVRIGGAHLENIAVQSDRTLVVENAMAGAGARAGESFAHTISVNRNEHAGTVRDSGADLVVNDLSELRVDASGNISLKRIADLPRIGDVDLQSLKDASKLAILLDYDGTLTPIVSDYRRARLADAVRSTLGRLAEQHTLAVISGRDLEDVRRLVSLDSIFYSGSHGFELAGPDGYAHTHELAAAYLPDLDNAEATLGEALANIPGHAIERKRFSIAVHYRQVDDAHVAELEAAVHKHLDANRRLRLGLGKKVFELKPALTWDKGRAVELLLATLGFNANGSLAVFIGDDVTDEAVFRVLRRPNFSVVIDDSDRVTAADYALADTDEVGRFLAWLAKPESGTFT